MPEGALAQFSHNDDEAPANTWSLPTVFGANAGSPVLVSPTLIDSDFGLFGTLELICLGGAQVPAKEFLYFWRDCRLTFTRNGLYPASTI
jgi:hypothetical protein